MKYILDTAPWANSVTMPNVIPGRILELLASEEIKGLCSVSLLEAAILHRLGRFRVNGTLAEFFEAGLSEDLEILELNAEIAATTNSLPDTFEGDPFDRTIAATARVLDLTLVTCDSAIRDSGVCAVEYYPFKPARRFPGEG